MAVSLDEDAWLEYGHSRYVTFKPSDDADAMRFRELGCDGPTLLALARNPLDNFRRASDQATLSFELTGVRCEIHHSTFSAEGSITGKALRGEHFHERMSGPGSHDLFGLAVSKGASGIATVLSLQISPASVPAIPAAPSTPAR